MARATTTSESAFAICSCHYKPRLDRKPRWGPNSSIAEGGTLCDCNRVSRYISGKLTSRGEAPKSVDEQNRRQISRERERERGIGETRKSKKEIRKK